MSAAWPLIGSLNEFRLREHSGVGVRLDSGCNCDRGNDRKMSRARELTYRVANAGLIGALTRLHRLFGSRTRYQIGPDGAAAEFESCWFSYSPREFGCTGNIDYVPDAENSTRHALFDRFKDGQVFYDVGAHGGVYTVTLLKRFPGAQVHSFEPQPEDLRRNLALNGMTDSNVHQVAVGNEVGWVKMTTRNRSSNHVSEKGDLPVPIVRLDDYVAERKLPPPHWIKIDIEGLELPALRGAERILSGHHPTVICEINHLYGRFGTAIPDFLGFMRSLRYEIYRLKDGELEPIPQAGSFEALGYSANWNFWFLPENR